MTRQALIIVGILLALLFLVLSTGQMWIIQIPLTLPLGWIAYLRRTLPLVQLNWSAVGLCAVALPLTIILTHTMCVWAWKGIGNNNPFRWKWTFSGLSILTLMFFVGMAATGIVHQTGWLITSPKPLVQSSFSGRFKANRLKCASDLRLMHAYIMLYSRSHPDFKLKTVEDLVDAVSDSAATAHLLVCSASNQDAAPGTQPSDWRDLVLKEPHRYISYTIAPGDVLGPDNTRHVLLYDETIENHEDGLNVLYEDGEVVWLDEVDAKAWLDKIAKHPVILLSDE